MRDETKTSCGCVWFVTTVVLLIASICAGAHRLNVSRQRVRLVRTERLGGWTARVIRVGPWSEEKGAWVGRTRLDIEFIDPKGSVTSARTNFVKLEPALDFVRAELRKRSGVVRAT